MTAEEHLNEVKKLATARVKAAKVAAEHEGLVLVDRKRIDALDELLVLVAVAFSEDHCHMTRDYKDVQQITGQTYNGKRFLLDRHEGEAVMRHLLEFNCKSLPSGWLASD